MSVFPSFLENVQDDLLELILAELCSEAEEICSHMRLAVSVFQRGRLPVDFVELYPAPL